MRSVPESCFHTTPLPRRPLPTLDRTLVPPATPKNRDTFWRESDPHMGQLCRNANTVAVDGCRKTRCGVLHIVKSNSSQQFDPPFIDEKGGYRGWDLWQNDRALAVHIIDSWPDNGMKVVTSGDALKTGQWQHVVVTYTGLAAPALLIYLAFTRPSCSEFGISIRLRRLQSPARVSDHPTQGGSWHYSVPRHVKSAPMVTSPCSV